MQMSLSKNGASPWKVEKIGVIGPGIVGMPMAALLAHARVREGTDRPAVVTVLQRASPTSGWKVGAINSGQSPIGGVEPDLDRIVSETVSAGLLRATHDPAELRDADVILVCVQTDKAGLAPEYGPLFEALNDVAKVLRNRPPGTVPLIVFESTLAPSSMATLVREHFAGFGLQEGRDVLLGNSPNRVMPGRLVERIATSDKIVGGLDPRTPELITKLYRHIVTTGQLLPSNSLTAEIVKTLENAYRDVRIAYAAELARYCDEADVDFYQLREAVNERLAQSDGATDDSSAVPTGGLLVPTIGVGGHCLPKDGVLLWWRAIEHGENSRGSLILASRLINDRSPEYSRRLAERRFGVLAGRRIAVLGAAYRPDSEDTRNSPSLAFAQLLLAQGCQVTIHDPFVREHDPNLVKLGLHDLLTRELGMAMAEADVVFVCTAHREYAQRREEILRGGIRTTGVFDACNLFRASELHDNGVSFGGIGRGNRRPSATLVSHALSGFRAVERGFALEIRQLIAFLNRHYAKDAFNRAEFTEVQRLAATCGTGCHVVNPDEVDVTYVHNGAGSRLAALGMGLGSSALDLAF
jgi:UDP-N-acetyl-D-mannosaminuronic acid dehydrogenase